MFYFVLKCKYIIFDLYSFHFIILLKTMFGKILLAVFLLMTIASAGRCGCRGGRGGNLVGGNFNSLYNSNHNLVCGNENQLAYSNHNAVYGSCNGLWNSNCNSVAGHGNYLQNTNGNAVWGCGNSIVNGCY